MTHNPTPPANPARFIWPVVYPLAGNPNDWRGDDVWPAMIGAGVLWGTAFLAAGWANRRLECKGWSQAVRRALYVFILWASAALIWTFMITTMAFAQPASAETCHQQDLSGLRVCSDREAAAIAGRPGWMGCSGRCVIVSDVEAVSFMNRQLQVAARFEGASFLTGTGNTRDLHRLPLLAVDNHLVLIDPDTFKTVGRFPLAGLADGDPALMPRFIEEAQISTDGRRFFIPSPDGPGFSAYEIVGNDLVPLAPADPVIVISPSGRYGLAVNPDDDGTFMLRDYASGTSLKTELRFDVDQAFFDVDEQYLLRRDRHMAGPRLTIYRLLNGEHVGTLAWPETGGMNVRVGFDKAGGTLTDMLPALD